MTGAVSSGLIEFFPPAVRFVIVFCLFSFLPGVLLRRSLGVFDNVGGAARIASSAVLGVAFHLIVAWVASLLSFSFSTFLWISQVASGVLFAGFLLAGAKWTNGNTKSRSIRSDSTAILIAGVIGVSFMVSPVSMSTETSAYDQIAYVRALIADDSMVSAGVLANRTGEQTSGGDPRMGLFHTLVAGMAEQSNLTPLEMWRWLPMIMAPLALLAFATFAGLFLPGPGYLVVALALFLGFQAGSGWEFLATASEGQYFVFTFFWLLLAAILQGSQHSWRYWIVVILLAVGGVLVHASMAIFVGIAVLTVLPFHRLFSIQLGKALQVTIVVGVCAVLVFWWRAVTMAGVGPVPVVGMLYFFERGSSYFAPSPFRVLETQGALFMAAVGVLCILPFVKVEKRFARMLFAVSLPAILIGFNPWFVPFLNRLGLGIVGSIQLVPAVWPATAFAVGTLVVSARKGSWLSKLFFAVVLLVWAQLALIDTLRLPPGAESAAENNRQELIEFFGENIPSGAVVLTDPSSSYQLSAQTDIRVVALPEQWGTANRGDAVLRQQAVDNVLSRFTTQIEAVGFLQEFEVHYVALDRDTWDPDTERIIDRKLQGLDPVLTRIHESEDLVVYRVGSMEGEIDYNWFPELPFTGEAFVQFTLCPAGPRPRPIRVSALSINPSPALAGEELSMMMGYRRETESPDESSFAVLIRFDRRDYFVGRQRYPGDRLVQWIHEATQGRVRYDVVHDPFAGLFSPTVWPMAIDIYETFSMHLPRELEEGIYSVSIASGNKENTSNVTFRDLMYSDDSFKGIPCKEIDVRHFLTR